jgi:hypothetical protein
MATFTARFGGRCGSCGEGIRVGDECDWVDDSVVHAGCKGVTRPKGAPETVCPRCFLTACDCAA